MTEPPVMVITGGSGFIGRHLVEHFTSAGWAVRAPTRPDWELGRTLGDVLEGAQVVIHAALVPYDRPQARRTNLEGTRALLREVRQRHRVKFIFLSSMSAHDAAVSDYGRDKLEIQSWLDGSRELAIRPGLVLGEAGLFERIRKLVSRGGLVPVVGGGQRLQTVHVDDLVAAVDAAIARDLSGVVAVAEVEPVAFRTLLAAAATRMGIRVRLVPVPFWPVDIGLRVAGVLRIPLPVSRANLAGLRALRIADVSADLRRLGIEVRDYRSSLQALIPRPPG